MDLVSLLQNRSSDLESWHAERDDLVSDAKWLREDLCILQADKLNHVVHINRLTSQLRELRSEKQGHAAHTNRLTSQLHEQLSDMQAHTVQLNRLTSQLEELRSEKQERAAHINSLTSQLQEQLSDRQAHVVQLNSLNTQVAKQLFDQQAASTHLASLDAFTNTLQAEKHAMSEQVSHLEEQLHKERADQDGLRTRHINLRAHKDALATTWQKESGNLYSQLDALAAEKEQLATQKQQLVLCNSQLRTDIDDLERGTSDDTEHLKRFTTIKRHEIDSLTQQATNHLNALAQARAALEVSTAEQSCLLETFMCNAANQLMGTVYAMGTWEMAMVAFIASHPTDEVRYSLWIEILYNSLALPTSRTAPKALKLRALLFFHSDKYPRSVLCCKLWVRLCEEAFTTMMR